MYNVSLRESYFPAHGGPELESMTIGKMLRASAAEKPDRPALKELGSDGAVGRSWDEQVVCFMRCNGGDGPDDACLKTFVRQRLSPRKAPAQWIWVHQWPLTGPGKIQKFKRREAFQQGEYDAALN